MRLKFVVLTAAFSAALLGTIPARASGVSVAVIDANGRPLTGAVVSIDVPGTMKPTPHGPYIMSQRNIAFDPHILIVPAGSMVLFPNKDQVRHHVYSFSRVKKFEIKLYSRDETKSEKFDLPGVVSLGCNIHDSMSGFIYVTATPFTAMTDAGGHVNFSDVPSGAAVLRVWEPSIRAPDNTLARAIDVSPGGVKLTFATR